MPDRTRSADELKFLADYDAGAWPRPSLRVDVVLLTVLDDALRTVLYRRSRHPDQGRWALPGAWVGVDEGLESAAARALRDGAGLEGVFLEQLYTFGRLDRDPRTRVVSSAWYALVLPGALTGTTGVVADVHVPWAGEAGGPVECRDEDGEGLPLAFDHAHMLGTAVQRIRGKLAYVPLALELLPVAFTLRQARRVHEAVLGRPLNKDSFRRTLLASGLIEPTGGRSSGVGRPAALYRARPGARPDPFTTRPNRGG